MAVIEGESKVELYKNIGSKIYLVKRAYPQWAKSALHQLLKGQSI